MIKSLLIAVMLLFTPVMTSLATPTEAQAAYRSNTAFKTANTYPTKWRYARLDSKIDHWGYYNRECVSYVAWKIHEKGYKAPYWWGNAKTWIKQAKLAKMYVSSVAKPGRVGVSTTWGKYGHVVYVHKVKAGWVYVSQYNAYIRGGYTNYKYKQSTFKYIQFTERR